MRATYVRTRVCVCPHVKRTIIVGIYYAKKYVRDEEVLNAKEEQEPKRSQHSCAAVST